MSSRNSPCPCGSGKRYKHCCGSLGANPPPKPITAPDGSSPYMENGHFRPEFRGRGMLPFCQDMPAGNAPALPWAPPGLLIVEDYLDRIILDRWHEHFRRQKTAPATTQDVSVGSAGGQPKFQVSEHRITEMVPKGQLRPEIENVLVTAYRDVITPFFSEELAWMQQPDVLKYVSGGRYDGHADSEYWNMDTHRWIRSLDRDLSVLVYVNESYEGGTLYFPNFDLRIKPRPGMLIAFPSDHRYLHAAEPITSGERYTVVCWAAVKSSKKLHGMPFSAIKA